jgi:hypothetical protein
VNGAFSDDLTPIWRLRHFGGENPAGVVWHRAHTPTWAPPSATSASHSGRLPAPPANGTVHPASRLGKWQDRARVLLTREFFDREYTTARKSLHQIEAETGIPSAHLAARARDHGIPLVDARQPAPIDPQWLRDQYARRSYSDIAAELGVNVMTVIAAGSRHGIPSRPEGVHSRPEVITTLGEDIPPGIRRAVEGSRHGWQRLHRFREAMAYPAIGTAAMQIGARPSALIHQFQRLERDIGATLYHRSSPGHPCGRPLAATHSFRPSANPAVRALEPPQRDASQPPGQDPPRC